MPQQSHASALLLAPAKGRPGCSSHTHPVSSHTLHVIYSIPLSASRGDCGRRRVLDLQPAVGATGAIGRTEALRHDALAAERASLTIDDHAIRDEVRVERDARVLAAQ